MLLAIGPLGPVKLLRSYCWRKIPLSASEQPKEVRDPDCTLTQPDATAVRELGGDFPGNLLLSGAAIECPLWGQLRSYATSSATGCRAPIPAICQTRNRTTRSDTQVAFVAANRIVEL